MTAHQAPMRENETGSNDPAGHVAQLCAIIALVERMTAEDAPSPPVPDDQAIAEAYARAPDIARRRFDRLSREAAGIATAGVEALIAGEGSPHAAARLAASLRGAVERLARLVGQEFFEAAVPPATSVDSTPSSASD